MYSTEHKAGSGPDTDTDTYVVSRAAAERVQVHPRHIAILNTSTMMALPLLLLGLAGAASAEAETDGTIVRRFSDLGGKPYTVSYDERSMLVGGKPVLLMSGSAHYVRSTPEMWPEIFAKMKASGLNAVESCEQSIGVTRVVVACACRVSVL